MEPQSMRLISWNVAGRTSCGDGQVSALIKRNPDLVAIQEVRENSLRRFCDMFGQTRLSFLTESVHLAKRNGRTKGLLIGSRWPLQVLPLPDVPYRERVLSVMIESPWGNIELHTVHIPDGETHGWINTDTFEGLYRRLACMSEIPRILCGDFNSPQLETADGRVVTWGQEVRPNGEIVTEGTWRDHTGRVDTCSRIDRAERNVLAGLAEFDLCDVFRSLHARAMRQFSWYTATGVGRRFDHVFASRALNPIGCQYLHSVRERGLSDHSAIEADFEPQPAKRGSAG